MTTSLKVEKIMNAAGLQRRRLLQAIPAIASVLVIAPVQASSDVLQLSRTLMGTRTDLTLHGRPQDLPRAAELAWQEMARLEQMMSRFRSSSVVSALNLFAGIRPVAVPEEMMQVLKMAQAVSAVSNGAFDVTVGAYKDWNFDPAHPLLPAPQQLAQQVPLVNYRDLILDRKNGTAFLARRGMRIDLGGIAKLPILKAGMQVLHNAGVENAMINGGGDVMLSGALHGRPWRIGLRDPRAPDSLLGVVALNRGIVAASGDYERCFTCDGRKYHHILNPRNGYPSKGPHGLALVSDSLDDVNGLGAAIMVAGLQAGRQYLAHRAGVDAMIVDTNGAVWLSQGMQQRLS